ncbi:MAG TPA: hypothetical protein VEQ59_03040 [Polyangiaceae bacterium]|nr:hypothetical protein [Polyangiaceae bacterium]
MLGSLIIAGKLAAPSAVAHAAPLVAAGVGSAASSAAVFPPPSGAPAAGSATSAAPGASAAPQPSGLDTATKDGEDTVNSTLGDTVIQSDADLPRGLSQEQLDAIGSGKVPIHREGRYRSPLANPSLGGPATVRVGFVISEIRDYQIQDGSFSADFFMSFTADKPIPKLHPVFTNGHDTNCMGLVDVETFRFYRCTGTFTSPVDLLDYPFDTQNLDISVEDAVYGVDTIVFMADPRRTSLDASFRISGYSVASVGANTFKHQYPSRFDRDDLYVSRYKFTLALDRFAQSAAFSVFVPAFIIVLISLIGLWVPPEELEVRSNAGAPMLAAAVLFHYSLVQSLPATGYLTHADKLMLGVYVSLFMNMVTTWVFMIVEEDRIPFWFRFFRAWTPPATVLVMLAAVLA